ncbi:hypothetical protein [Prosthecomicrobium pneumaticum]|uniref:Uncharacterized protein n=1 Tax=Prosthecomicrobium pneumaticum TaxID=81895 RepID=A0A7W9FKZ4_9HYPH|nr:hypothetical protein [Prosthecomicrobium pneumaticum]MBB5751963.1 hypothetical protein [Prosthecomicrobium pneumaticum]
MPQLLLIAMIGTVTVLALRRIEKARAKVGARLRDMERTGADRPIATLVHDPETGLYRPVDRTE